MVDKHHYIETDPAVHFLGTLAQNAGSVLNLVSPDTYGFGPSCLFRVIGVQIVSVENLDWGVYLFRTNAFNTGAVGTLMPAGWWEFVAADAKRIGAAGPYMYSIDGNGIPYQDENGMGQVHLMLVNRSAAGKSADAAGAIKVSLIVELPGG